ncbi:hypothetical protein C7M84_010366, partial [Penaeus vannamei]
DCRIACWSDPRCVAASAVEAEDNSTLCRLSTKGPFDSTLVVNPNATYIFWNKDAMIMDDGLVYTEATRRGYFVEAEALCSGVPGHRVPVFKTRSQQDVMGQLLRLDSSRAFWVDLRKTSLTDYVWGDGTPFQDTEISAFLQINRGFATEAVHSYFSALLEKPKTGFLERVHRLPLLLLSWRETGSGGVGASFGVAALALSAAFLGLEGHGRSVARNARSGSI